MSIISSPTLLIVGAGAAGIACALSAAQQGIKVVLLEQSTAIGGTVTQALIHTLGGFFNDQGELLNSGLSKQLIERLTQASCFTHKRRIGKTWVLNVDPHVYQQVVSQWIKEYSSIEVYYQTTIDHLSVNAHRIDNMTFICNGKRHSLHPQRVIDSTGNAHVVRAIDSHLVINGEALAGVIIQLRGVIPNAVQFPKGVALLQRIRKAIEHNQLAPECATLWFDRGVYADEVYIKFNLMAVDYKVVRMEKISKQLLKFLHTQTDFSKAVISAYGQLGIRNGGRVQGDYTLTEADLKQGRNFDDAVCHACWPIEYWHPQHGLKLDYFPAGHTYQIPLSALKVKGLSNLFVAGQCFSAEPRAQASARVVGSCWAMAEGLVNYLFNFIKPS